MFNLLNEINSLCFYRDDLEKPVFKDFYELVKCLASPEVPISEAREHFYKLQSEIANYALNITHPTAKTAWENFIIEALISENAMNKALENQEPFAFKSTLESDLYVISRIYNFDFNQVIESLCPGTANVFSKRLFSEESALAKALKKGNKGKIYKALVEYIKKNGVGNFAGTKTFKINPDKEAKSILLPIESRVKKTMDDLVGYQSQKDKLIQNTQSLVNGSGGLNTLLYGDMGTGKSTMVKALTDTFRDTPLRFIEIKKDQLSEMPKIFEEVRKTNYPFILFIDDLSFDDGDQSYRAFKNALEGSFEELPENLVIYATSNKRTLVTQRKSEREDAVNAREVLEEKLSLVSRFGLMINFSVPNQSFYLDIVENLLEREGIESTDKIRNEAIQWELRHMNRSGRTAEQFIQHLKTNSDTSFIENN